MLIRWIQTSEARSEDSRQFSLQNLDNLPQNPIFVMIKLTIAHALPIHPLHCRISTTVNSEYPCASLSPCPIICCLPNTAIFWNCFQTYPMDVSDNKTDTERPNTTTSHEGDKEYDEYKKHDSDEEPRIGPPDERGPQKTPIRTASSGGANANTDSPQSSHSQKSVTSSNARSVPSTNPGTPSSDGSLYERYYVQPNALRIYRGDPDLRENLTEVSVGSTEHQEMRECVNIAMCILSRTRTRNVMATYSIGVVEHMESKHHWSTAGTLEVYGDGIPTAISKWLERLGRRFPDLYITPSMGPCYGYTQRFLWGDDIDGYPPQVAAEISIHSGVCSPND